MLRKEEQGWFLEDKNQGICCLRICTFGRARGCGQSSCDGNEGFRKGTKGKYISCNEDGKKVMCS